MKRRAPGVGCRHPGRKACRRGAVTEISGRRLCAMHAADTLFSRRIVAAAAGGDCWAWGYAFGCGGGLQCCHILTRGYHALRWSDDNAVAMCAGHHVWFTHHPEEWRTYVRGRGIDHDGLLYRANTQPAERPEDALERLLEAAA